MASEVDIVGSKESDFYAEYWHKEKLLRVLILNSEGQVLDERRGMDFDGWLELKSCENPKQTYLKHYRPKPIDYEWARKAGVFVSPAARRATPPEIEESRLRKEANKPMGCGMKLFLIWLGFTGLVLLASLAGNLLKR